MPRLPKQGSKCPVACTGCRRKKIRCDGASPCSNCKDHLEKCQYPVLEPRTRSRKQDPAVISLSKRLAVLERRLSEKGGSEPEEAIDLFTTERECGSGIQPTTLQLSPKAYLDTLHDIQGPFVSNPPAQEIRIRTASTAGSGETEQPMQASQTESLMDPDDTQRLEPAIQPLNYTDRVGSPKSNALRRQSDKLDYPLPLLDHSYQDPSTCDTYRCPSMIIPSTSSVSVTPRSVMHMDNCKLSKREVENAITEEESSLSPEDANFEHHGSASFLSICSDKGLRWVGKVAGPNDRQAIMDALRQFTSDVTRRLKLEHKLSPARVPDPDFDTAWSYTRAYFDESNDAFMGIINRPAFEQMLRDHYDRGLSSTDNGESDPVWYALRNTIFAGGCRFYASRESGDAKTLHDRSWRYFENALSVHTQLLYYPRTGLMAVQTLVAMAFVAEGILSPCIEYMICSVAVRLAQSIGLNLEPPRTWNLEDSQQRQRSRLWWTLYCYEKHLAMRSGRPSCIDDDNISCKPPEAPPNDTENFKIFGYFLQHGLITSSILKRLTSVKANRQTPSELINAVSELSESLESWRASLPPYLQPGRPINPSEFPPKVRMYQVLYVHFCYYGSLSAIHNRYPWMGSLFDINERPEVCSHALASTNIVAASSRSIIQATKYIDIDIASHVWLAFYFPVTALIHLFIHVLRFPLLDSASSDVALLDVAAGHFAKLELATSMELTYPFVRELAHIARRRVREAKMEMPPRPDDTLGEGFFSEELENINIMDFQMENWSSFQHLFPGIPDDQYIDGLFQEPRK